MTQTVERAIAYVNRVDLPAPREGVLSTDTTVTNFAFNTAKEQATVVGSDVIGFVKGISAEQRSDLVNASLLAQLRANKLMKNPQNLADVLAWYKEYFDVLANVGFVVQSSGFAEYEEKAHGLEVHEAILEVAKVALGSAPTALALVTRTLESLKSMTADSPWITLFNRESRSAKTARFQVTMVEPEAKGLLVEVMAFGLEATATVTQVLFFKVKKNDAKLRLHSGKATISPEVLAGVRAVIADKIKAHTTTFVAGLDI